VTAPELPIVPKTIELEQRLARLELSCAEMQRTVDSLKRRELALEAQVDHLLARLIGTR
jgi:hypothetical protein